jgi:hypothetical protein
MGPEPPHMFDSVGAALKKLGLSEEQLNSIKFSQKHRDRPIDEWPMTYDPDIKIAATPKLPSLMRRYAVLKFALVDGPAENSPQVSEAFALISNEQVAGLAAEGLAFFSRQKGAAQKPRGYIPEIRMTMREFVMEYALRGENRLLSALELWPGFGAHLRWNGLDGILKGDGYNYLNGKSLAFVTFRNYVGDARKTNSH